MQEVTERNITNKRNSIKDLVTMSLVFHNLNKMVEQKTGMSLVQYHFLNTLRDMPACSPQLLAKAVGMHPSTLTQSMKRLSRKGFIFVGEDPKDSRKKILSLTFDGKNALDTFESRVDSFLENEKRYSQLLP